MKKHLIKLSLTGFTAFCLVTGLMGGRANAQILAQRNADGTIVSRQTDPLGGYNTVVTNYPDIGPGTVQQYVIKQSPLGLGSSVYATSYPGVGKYMNLPIYTQPGDAAYGAYTDPRTVIGSTPGMFTNSYLQSDLMGSVNYNSAYSALPMMGMMGMMGMGGVGMTGLGVYPGLVSPAINPVLVNNMLAPVAAQNLNSQVPGLGTLAYLSTYSPWAVTNPLAVWATNNYLSGK